MRNKTCKSLNSKSLNISQFASEKDFVQQKLDSKPSGTSATAWLPLGKINRPATFFFRIEPNKTIKIKTRRRPFWYRPPTPLRRDPRQAPERERWFQYFATNWWLISLVNQFDSNITSRALNKKRVCWVKKRLMWKYPINLISLWTGVPTSSHQKCPPKLHTLKQWWWKWSWQWWLRWQFYCWQ